MINRNQLALFHAVAEEHGFGRAARRMHISQPAVSIQISQLEDTLGVRLFDRVGRTIRLTAAGETLAEYARRIAVLEAEAELAVADFSALRRGRIRIGASTTIAAWLLPQIIQEFHQRWPDIEAQMHVGNSAQVQQQVLDGLLDLGLTEGVEPHPDLVSEVFRDDQLVPIAAPVHPVMSVRRPTLKVFLKYPLIMRESGSGTRDSIMAFLSSRRVAAEAAMSFANSEAVKGAVAAGLGVSFASSLTIPGDVMLRRLAVVRLVDAAVIRRPFHVLQARGKAPNPAVEAFRKVLRTR